MDLQEKEVKMEPKATSAKKSGRKRKKSATTSDIEEVEQLCKDILCDDKDNILDDDYGVYTVYNKDKKWKLDQTPHHLLPSFNITQFTNIKDLRDFPLAQVSLPHSVCVCSKQVNKVDICHRRVIALNEHISRLKKLKAIYTGAVKKSKQVRKNEKNGIYERCLIEFTKWRHINPDVYFAKQYDFYYTGGNLCANLETNQILHASGDKMEKLILSQFTDQHGKPNVHQIAALDIADPSKEESEIFEMHFSKSQNDSFFVRRKLCISLHQYTDNKFCTKQKFCSKEVPFISFAQDKIYTTHLAISNLMHQVRLYDLEKSVPLQTYKLMADEEINPATNWNAIRSWDSNVYIYAAPRKINIIDTRVPVSEWQANYCGYDDKDSCDSFCSLALSNFDNLFYVASNHKAYCVDFRYMDKNIESKNCSVVRWTHQMRCCPLMMATSRHEDCEYLTLQSPLSVDLRICENIRHLPDSDGGIGICKKLKTEFPPEHKYKSPCLPYMPPSLESVFHEGRNHGVCIKPDTGIANRVKACSTGLSFVGDGCRSFLLTATSNGDIFARQFLHSDGDDGEHSEGPSAAEVMKGFAENIYRSVRKAPLQVTEVVDLSGIGKVFRCPILSEFQQPEDTLVAKPKRKYMGRWQKSLQSLRKFKDALVPDLLSIWEIDEEEEEKDLNLLPFSQSSVKDSTSLVSGWLNNTQDILHSTMLNMTSTPMEPLIDNSNTFTSEVDETVKLNDSEVPQLELTVAAPKPAKVSKKKSRYIKGF